MNINKQNSGSKALQEWISQLYNDVNVTVEYVNYLNEVIQLINNANTKFHLFHCLMESMFWLPSRIQMYGKRTNLFNAEVWIGN